MTARWGRTLRTGGALAVVLGSAVGFTAGPAAAAPKATMTVVASGFDNPRGLAVGEDGALYVAEAGRGGSVCVPGGPEGPTCPGLTSAVSIITAGGAHHRIVSGLISISGPGGVGATGADGLSRSPEGGLYTVITGCPQQTDHVPPGVFDPNVLATARKQLGQVGRVAHGKFDPIAGVGSFDWNWSLDHQSLNPQFPDCNPYGILAKASGAWVVDAASNTLDDVTGGGIEVEAYVPAPPVSDSVPTCVAQGPDHKLYIGELTGAGNKPGASTVWQFDTLTGRLTPWATGLTAVTGCGFGPDGKFYATEFSVLGFESFAPFTGAVVRVPPHSTSPIVVVGGLSFPNGFAATDDAIYVSNWSISPASPSPQGPPLKPGEVVKITLHEGDD